MKTFFFFLIFSVVTVMLNATHNNNYTLEVGIKGKERLQILNDIHNPQSLDLLTRNGLTLGSSVLEIGCGIGDLSCQIAKIVGNEGNVIGIDISQEQIELAQERALYEGLENINFIQLAANEINKLNREFDVIFVRLVLTHVDGVEEVLKKALSSLKTDGRLILEEGTGLDSLECYPEDTAFSNWRQLCCHQEALSKSDFRIGFKIPPLLKNMGCDIEKAMLYQAMLTNPTEKKIMRLGVLEAGPKLVEAGLLTAQQIEELTSGLEALELDDQKFCSYARIYQIVAKKKSVL